MVARHYAFTLGRFLQPDAPFADQSPGNPQTWNLYPYARNNPLYFVDPTGRAGCPWNPCTAMDAQGQLGSKSGYPTMNTVPVMGDSLPGMAPAFSIVMVEVTTLNWSVISWLATGDADALRPSEDQELMVRPTTELETSFRGKARLKVVRYDVVRAGKGEHPSEVKNQHNFKVTLTETLIKGKEPDKWCPGPKGCAAPGPARDTQQVKRGGDRIVEKRFAIDGNPVRIFDPETKRAYDFVRYDVSFKNGFVATYGNDEE
jgi:hypothetical protein